MESSVCCPSPPNTYSYVGEENVYSTRKSVEKSLLFTCNTNQIHALHPRSMDWLEELLQNSRKKFFSLRKVSALALAKLAQLGSTHCQIWPTLNFTCTLLCSCGPLCFCSCRAYLGCKFQFLATISGTSIESRIPILIPFPIPDIPDRIYVLNSAF
jgi:hypothetical protein